MASNIPSSSRLPAAAPSASRPKSDVFRPRFPLDPFSSIDPSLREPWSTTPDRLPPPAALAERRDVILVLGTPTEEELKPVLESPKHASCLIIIASHLPPAIPPWACCPVRVLRLSQPLAIEDSGAVRLVKVLEWAERVARLWRNKGGDGVYELTGEDDGNSLTPLLPSAPRLLSRRASRAVSASVPVSAQASYVSLNSVRPRSLFSRPSLLPLKKGPSSETIRPFDALLNFIPGDLPHKVQLKHCILVTTISRPFLARKLPPTPPARPARAPGSSRPPSLLTGKSVSAPSSSALYSLPSPAPSQSNDSLYGALLSALSARAHVVHLLQAPARRAYESQGRALADARAKLVQSMEGFLSSFSAPPAGLDDGVERAAPFLMLAGTFGAPAPLAEDTLVADLVLGGALDNQYAPRAWLAVAEDIELRAQGERQLGARTVSQPLPSAVGREWTPPPTPGREAYEQAPPPTVPIPSYNHAGFGRPRVPLPSPPESDESDSSAIARREAEGYMAARPAEVPRVEKRRSRWKFWQGGSAEKVSAKASGKMRAMDKPAVLVRAR